MVALALWAASAASALAACCGSNPAPEEATVAQVTHEHDPLAAGLAALRARDFVRAEREFARARDPVRLAEALYHQGRDDEAGLALDQAAGEPAARYLLGLLARRRGDLAEAGRQLRGARDAGYAPARLLLQLPDWRGLA